MGDFYLLPSHLRSLYRFHIGLRARQDPVYAISNMRIGRAWTGEAGQRASEHQQSSGAASAKPIETAAYPRYSSAMAAARQQINVDLDAEVASILRSHAAEAHVSEGEIVDRALRAYDLRSLVAQIRTRSDLDEDTAMALVRQELHAARAERDAA